MNIAANKWNIPMQFMSHSQMLYSEHSHLQSLLGGKGSPTSIPKNWNRTPLIVTETL